MRLGLWRRTVKSLTPDGFWRRQEIAYTRTLYVSRRLLMGHEVEAVKAAFDAADRAFDEADKIVGQIEGYHSEQRQRQAEARS